MCRYLILIFLYLNIQYILINAINHWVIAKDGKIQPQVIVFFLYFVLILKYLQF